MKALVLSLLLTACIPEDVCGNWDANSRDHPPPTETCSEDHAARVIEREVCTGDEGVHEVRDVVPCDAGRSCVYDGKSATCEPR